MDQFHEVVYVVYIIPYKIYGKVEKMGLYASKVFYNQDGFDYEEEMPNEDFIIMDEIVFTRYIEKDEGQ